MIALNPLPKFELGRLQATTAALEAIQQSGEEIESYLNRHIHGDWGSVSEADRLANDQAVVEGGRIVSVHRTGNGIKIWIITEAADESGNRPSTIVQLAAE